MVHVKVSRSQLLLVSSLMIYVVLMNFVIRSVKHSQIKFKVLKLLYSINMITD